MKNSNKNIDQRFIGELICLLKMTSSIDFEYVWMVQEETKWKDKYEMWFKWCECILFVNHLFAAFFAIGNWIWLLLITAFKPRYYEHIASTTNYEFNFFIRKMSYQKRKNQVMYCILCKKGTNKSNIDCLVVPEASIVKSVSFRTPTMIWMKHLLRKTKSIKFSNFIACFLTIQRYSERLAHVSDTHQKFHSCS